MDSALATIILVTVVLFGTLTLTDTYFSMQDALMVATQAMDARHREQAGTALTLLTAETKDTGALVELTYRNTGSTKLADFDQWDVVIQYYTAQDAYLIKWLPYGTATTPIDNQWTVAGLYRDAATASQEVYEPKILNPGEEIVLRIKLFPNMGPQTSTLVTVAVPNGTYLSAVFDN
ncbi:MAG: hypothetical protein KF832_24065 [Caldilineaceae bacterium]|nr:hypothetical protein [Caldilineaceae bacterium]